MDFISVLTYASIYIGLVAITFYVLSYFDDKRRKKDYFTDKELPTVSVIIPAYNEEESIARTIESILASDYPNKFEIIVIDDGSKDDTFKIAKKYSRKGVKVFTKENGGKGAALNFGLSKAKGEIIFTMDADTFVEPYSMKEMVRYFKSEKVMSVTPAMVVQKPKTILQRVQQVEYALGLFLRKVFATLNSIFIAPGAFAAYRKSFFDKYGGYDEKNITEDLEVSLRIQFNGFYTENCPDAPAYTIAPGKFGELLKQRRRWYFGLIKNTIQYRKMFGRRYGDLGLFVMPIAWISILFSIIMISYVIVHVLMKLKEEVLFFGGINFDFMNSIRINSYLIERAIFSILTNPIFLSMIFFLAVFGFYLHYASKKIGKISGLVINLTLFFFLFAGLFGFWWIVSIFYSIFKKSIDWG